jgi:hypothetical protein
MFNKQNCVEIRLPLTSGKKRFSSGYAIGNDLVLTCYHGLCHNERVPGGKISLTRHESGEPVEVDREKICWFNKEHDVALIHCPFPKAGELETPIQTLTFRRMDIDEKWDSCGYLANLEHPDGEREWITPKGKIHADRTDLLDALWVTEGYVEDPEKWQGFSGSPVFVNGKRKIAGVVCWASEGSHGQRIKATPLSVLSDALCDQNETPFKEVLGWDEKFLCKQRQQDCHNDMLAAIKDRDKLRVAFCTQLRVQGAKGDLQPDANKLIEAFNQLDHDSAVTCLLETVRALARQSCREDAKAIGRFALAWLPATLTYDQHLDRIRAELADMEKPATVLPTQSTLSTEVLLSVVEQSSVRLLLHKGYLMPEMDLGNLPELGMDEDNTQLKREVDEALKARFCSDAEHIRLEQVLQRLLKEVAKSKKLDMHLERHSGDELNQVLSRILDSLHRSMKRRFFIELPMSDDYDMNRLAPIRKAFAPLALLISRCDDPLAEIDRYVELERIVKLGLGDESLYEEMRK